MFSYRHAFHAGNHADVLKHAVWVFILQYLTQKPAPLSVIDTHAGAGMYRLDGEQARTSAEAEEGVDRLFEALSAGTELQPLLAAYTDAIAAFNTEGTLRHYPGSPLLTHSLLRGGDRLKLFEVHPTDVKILQANVKALDSGASAEVLREDGFEGLRKLLPPPVLGGSRRAAVLMDPSYELKTDYAATAKTIELALERFPTGCYAVWYPLIARPEAHSLPRRLKTLATKASKPFVHATLNIGSDANKAAAAREALGTAPGGKTGRAVSGDGMRASGVFVINPPFTLKAALAQALPQLVKLLGRGRGQAHTLESAG
jgi:23S rRNA (adenine2030-N6)-methyltransferase